MSITPGWALILTVLTALAPIGCGDGTTNIGAETTAGSGGNSGEGGSMAPPEIEDFSCDDIQEDFLINGYIDELNKYHESYQPDDVTIKTGQVLKFQPYDSVQNMESGVNKVKDGKFHTPQGRRWCLVFHVPGTYPFFSIGAGNPMNGMLHVE